MRDNPVQFAVVREDPRVEIELAKRARTDGRAPRVLLIASGGCTALSLRALVPDALLTLVDSNPAQLSHVAAKADALWLTDPAKRRACLNIGDDDTRGLNQRGNFESLFRGLRSLVSDLVASPAELERALDDTPDRLEHVERILSGRYWRAAFALFFADPILEAMFGPAATQHADPDSYPDYFRARMERALLSTTAPTNYFLHHIFLGAYRDDPRALPPYLTTPPNRDAPPLKLVAGHLEDVTEDWSEFDVVSLSNIFDWMSDGAARKTAQLLRARMKPGAVVVWRQLNNTRTTAQEAMRAAFNFDVPLAQSLLADEQSYFYEGLLVGRRR